MRYVALSAFTISAVVACVVMALAENGQVALDARVSEYLSRFKLQGSEFGAVGVKGRHLLNYTAGTPDGLGYDGADTAQDRQSLEASLARVEDASFLKNAE